jgi:hypothetical protein
MNEFKDQLDAAEKEKVSKLISELRELAVKGQAADPSITAEIIKEKIDATQQASLGLFQKVCPHLALPSQYHADVLIFLAGLREEERREQHRVRIL